MAIKYVLTVKLLESQSCRTSVQVSVSEAEKQMKHRGRLIPQSLWFQRTNLPARDELG